ncbi:hypothetical protein [Pseudanabaena mucicola]|uniref:Phage protein n=1 Tax=Pseudanabaena mucicola FACHB-723 TaxID=2692860 RepID=A0ABR8A190_9CYAN|nr:hypothetical protein [Pseudanabaena mucicola]MBD2189996.1 hypothetical protein [Pseudanabaena mucicola FACHB-723]
MAKLFMLQTALNNLTQEGTAEIYGTGWKLVLSTDDHLYVDCGDDGFTYQIYYAESNSFSVVEELESVSELKELIV